MGSWGQIQRSSWNIWLDSGIMWWLVGWPFDKELRLCQTCKMLCHPSQAGMPAVQKRSGREIVFARRTSIKAASSSPTIERWRPDRQQALVAITFHLKVGGLHLSLTFSQLLSNFTWVDSLDTSHVFGRETQLCHKKSMKKLDIRRHWYFSHPRPEVQVEDQSLN